MSNFALGRGMETGLDCIQMIVSPRPSRSTRSYAAFLTQAISHFTPSLRVRATA